jgi:hypothetical protein
MASILRSIEMSAQQLHWLFQFGFPAGPQFQQDHEEQLRRHLSDFAYQVGNLDRVLRGRETPNPDYMVLELLYETCGWDTVNWWWASTISSRVAKLTASNSQTRKPQSSATDSLEGLRAVIGAQEVGGKLAGLSTLVNGRDFGHTSAPQGGLAEALVL